MNEYWILDILLFSLPVVFATTPNDSCPVIHLFNYVWEDCGTIWTWSVLGIPLLAIITAPIGIVLAIMIWRIRK